MLYTENRIEAFSILRSFIFFLFVQHLLQIFPIFIDKRTEKCPKFRIFSPELQNLPVFFQYFPIFPIFSRFFPFFLNFSINFRGSFSSPKSMHFRVYICCHCASSFFKEVYTSQFNCSENLEFLKNSCHIFSIYFPHFFPFFFYFCLSTHTSLRSSLFLFCFSVLI